LASLCRLARSIQPLATINPACLPRLIWCAGFDQHPSQLHLDPIAASGDESLTIEFGLSFMNTSEHLVRGAVFEHSYLHGLSTLPLSSE
jgi:hypothetical protein